MPKTSSFETISTQQQRIATLAKQMPGRALTTLAHHLDLAWLREAYRRTRKDGATGVDGQTAAEYAEHLEVNLLSLLDRAKTGRYRAPPVRRVYIPKGNRGDTRPLGIPTFEDKVLQRAVAMLLEPIYEHDFYPCSFGFRPGRSAHQALDALWRRAMDVGGGWILEIDIRKFFDNLDHRHLRRILRQRVRDGVLLRLIDKWLKAGVLEEGVVIHPDAGSPQGGVISPILANAYLHEVLDTWFEQTVKPRLSGRSFLIRYADDAVLIFERERDARRVLEVISKRFAKYGLELHPEKTRLVRFERPGPAGPDSRDKRPGAFDFLGFTHYWQRTYKGIWAVKRKTASARFRRSLQSLSLWCRRHRHTPIHAQWEVLSQKLRGHYAYYGIIGNTPSLGRFRRCASRLWRKWLCRRSQRARLSWEQFTRLEQRYPLPPAVRPRSQHRT